MTRAATRPTPAREVAPVWWTAICVGTLVPARRNPSCAENASGVPTEVPSPDRGAGPGLRAGSCIGVQHAPELCARRLSATRWRLEWK
jgi:hypothetical protein